MSNEYLDLKVSLLRYIADFATEFGLTALNLDAFANPTDWPPGDFIGLAELQMDTDLPFRTASLAFVVSTRQDINLMRMDSLMNTLDSRLQPTKSIPMLDSVTGLQRGRLSVLNGTRVGRVINTESQPAKPFFITFRSDQTVRL